MVDNKILINSLLHEIDTLADEKNKKWWEMIVKHGTTFRGVRIPQIREVLKKWYIKEQIHTLSLRRQLNLALSFFAEEYAEDKISGILFLQIYLYDKFDYKLLLSNFKKLFENNYIYDWNITDWLCVRVLRAMIKEHGMSCAKEISKWVTAQNVWQARCAIVAFANYLTKEQEEFIPLIIESSSILIRRKERFAKTAVGWLLREISKVNKELTNDFIQKNVAFFSKESLENAIKYFDQNEKKKIKALQN